MQLWNKRRLFETVIKHECKECGGVTRIHRTTDEYQIWAMVLVPTVIFLTLVIALR